MRRTAGIPRWRLVGGLVLLLGLAPGCRSGEVRSESLASTSLGGTVSYHVLLPPGYDRAQRYPVLWLLHGLGGNDRTWLDQTSLAKVAARYPMIVVLPAGGRSFYVDSPLLPRSAYEDYLVRELHATIAARYSIDTLREAIAGASMGAYGAAELALRYPARYRFAGLVLPALSIPDSLGPADSAFAPWLIPVLDSAFGPPPNSHRAEHDPFKLLVNAPPDALPAFWLTVAKDDPFPSYRPSALAFAEAVRRRGGRVEYQEIPGGHDAAALETALPRLLERAWEEFQLPATKP